MADIKTAQAAIPTDTTTADVSAIKNFMDNTKLHPIKIAISAESWKQFNDALTNNLYTDFDVPVDVTIDGTLVKGASLKPHGNMTRAVLQKADGSLHKGNIELKFDDTWGLAPGSAEYNAASNRTYSGLKGVWIKLMRDPDMMGNPDTTLSAEIFAYKTYAKAGLPTPLTSSATITISVQNANGTVTDLNYGLATLVEPVKKEVLTRVLGSDQDSGYLYKCLARGVSNTFGQADLTYRSLGMTDPWGRKSYGIEDRGQTPSYLEPYDLVSNKTRPSWDMLFSFVENTERLTGSSFVDYIDTNFEVDSFLRMLAIDQLLGAGDSLPNNFNNYFLYCNPKTRKYMIFAYDRHQILGIGWEPFDAANQSLSQFVTLKDTDGSTRSMPLLTKIMATPKYYNQYLAYVKQFASDGTVSYAAFQNVFSTLQGLYAAHLNDDSATADANIKTTTMVIPARVQTWFDQRLRSVATQLGLPATTFSNGAIPTPTLPYNLSLDTNKTITMAQDPVNTNLYTGIINDQKSWGFFIDDANAMGDWVLGDSLSDGTTVTTGSSYLYGGKIKLPQTMTFPIKVTYNALSQAYNFASMYQSVYKSMGITTDKDWINAIPMSLISNNTWQLKLKVADFGVGQVFKFTGFKTNVHASGTAEDYLGDTNADGWADLDSAAWVISTGPGTYTINDKTLQITYTP